MSKIALVARHIARSQGVVRVTDRRSGYDINSDLAAAIRDLDPARYVIVPRMAILAQMSAQGIDRLSPLRDQPLPDAEDTGCALRLLAPDRDKAHARSLPFAFSNDPPDCLSAPQTA